MAELELALAASARGWSEALHRFLADHGGARVRTVVMGPEEVVAESYDVLLIDDICSFLTPRLVEQARRHGRLVVGVFEGGDGSDAKRRLLDCGVDDVIEAEASPDEFLSAVARVRQLAPLPKDPSVAAAPAEPSGEVIAVGSPPGGCGATEVVVGLGSEIDSVVVDADDIAPGLAQRLGAPLHPNLRAAIDIVHHRSGPVDAVLSNSAGLRIVAGLVSGDEWEQLHQGEVEAVIEEFASLYDRVIANLGSGLERPQLGEGRFGLARGLVRRADRIVAVGAPNPVGVTRLIRWVSEAMLLAPDCRLSVVINRAPRSTFRRSEISTELERALGGVPILFLPEDVRVAEAAWAGTVVTSGPFRRAIRRLAAEL